MKLLLAVGAAAALVLATTNQPAWEPPETAPPTSTTVAEAFPGHQEEEVAQTVGDRRPVSYVPEDTPAEVVESLVSDLTDQLKAENPDAVIDYIAVRFHDARSATVTWAWKTPDDGQYRLAGVRWTRSRDGRWDPFPQETNR